jgi:hypothetical protein
MQLTNEEKQVFHKMAQASKEKRFAGKTPEEISKYMSDIRKKGIANKLGTS